MAETDTTQPHAIERWVERKLPGYRFGLVLLLLLMTCVFMASGITSSSGRVVTVALQAFTLLAALRASQVRRRTLRIAVLVAFVAFVAAVVSVTITTSDNATGALFVLNILIVAAAPIAIANALWHRPVVDIHTVLGAICIYVLMGMMFAFLYAAIGYFAADPFFVQTDDATTSEYLYFSFITLSTVGYGDFTAAGNLGRSLSSLEGVLGQLYLVTIVATIVSRMTPRAIRSEN
jgi:hypothetical protein